MSSLSSDRAARRRNVVLAASLLFLLVGTGSVYFLVIALKLIAAEFSWPRAVPVQPTRDVARPARGLAAR